MPVHSYKILGQATSGDYYIRPIPTRALTSNVALITSASHGMLAGDRFDISATDQAILNIRAVVASVPDVNSFTYPRSSGNIGSGNITTGYFYAYKNNQGRAVTNVTKTSGIATLTTSTAHSFFPGDFITVWVNNTNFDGDWVILDCPTATTFRYVNIGSDVGSTAISSGAVAIQKSIDLYTVPAQAQAVVSTLSVSNSLTHSAYFCAYTVRSGESKSSPPDKSIIANRIAVDASETYSMTMGYTLNAGDSVCVRAGFAGMYFNLYGSELT
jgi:hypothetical protein